MPGSVVDCAAYAEGRRVADVSLDDLPAALSVPGQFVWLALIEPSEEELRRVQRTFGLHDLAIEDALRAHQRPKLEEYGDHLFVVLRTVQRQPDGKIGAGETHCFVGERFLVSIRHGRSSSYVEVRHRCECTPQLLAKGPSFALYAIMDFVVDQFFPVVDAIEDELTKLEEIVFAEQKRRSATERLYRLKRRLLTLKRAVLPLVEVFNRVVRFDSGRVSEEMRPYFRDVYDHVLRINEAADSLRDMLSQAVEANLSLVGIRQNEIMKALASWAAILAVPTMVAGIYGMNFEDIPELHWRYGYVYAWGLMVGISAVLSPLFPVRGGAVLGAPRWPG